MSKLLLFLFTCSILAQTNHAGRLQKLMRPRAEKLTSSQIAEIAALRQVSVPHRRQDGATCGLYALGMVMDYHHQKNPRNLNPRVQNVEGEKGSPTLQPLLEHARKEGHLLSEDGGTVHWNLQNLARAYGYDSVADSHLQGRPSLADLRKELAGGRPVVVAIPDVDERGMPKRRTSILDLESHWVILEGIVDYQGQQYAVVSHGHENAHHVVWPLRDFLNAWNECLGATVYVRPRY